MALKTLRATTRVRAPIEAVFEALTHVETYPHWNSLVPQVDAPEGVGVGKPFILHVTYPNGKKTFARDRVMALDPPRDGRAKFAYAYRGRAHPLLVRGGREWLLESEGEITRVTSIETLEGPLVRFAPWEQICQGIQESLDGLQLYLEG